MNKHLEKWQPTARKQLVVYLVGLRKTLSETYYSSTTNNSSSNKMSINSYLLYQLHLCQKCHMKMRWMKQKKMVLIILKALTRMKTNSNQKTTYYWNRQEENQMIPPRTFLLSSHPLQNLKVFLMWSCLLSSLDSFEVFWIQSLTVLRTLVKEKQLKPN